MACTLLSTRICNGALYDERRIHSRKVERETLEERYTRIASKESIVASGRLSASLSTLLSLSLPPPPFISSAFPRCAWTLGQLGPTTEIGQRRISRNPDPPIRVFAPLRSRT